MDGEGCPSIAHALYVDFWWLRPVVPDVDEAGEIGCDLDSVHPRRASQALGFTTIQRNPEELALPWALLPADEIELAALLVQCHRRLGRPVAPRQLPDRFSIGRI